MTYSVIFDDTDPVNWFPALLAFVPTELTDSWVEFFRETETAQKRQHDPYRQFTSTIGAEVITDETQIGDYLERGMVRARWIPEMPDMLRRAGVDANRALHGMKPLERGSEAWWRMTLEQAARAPAGKALLPFLGLDTSKLDALNP